MATTTSILIGNESLLIQCAEILLERGHRIGLVVTSNAAVGNWAAAHGVPASEWGNDLATQLAAYEFDWLFSIANLRIVPDGAIARARRGAINFHDGLLPDSAGLNTPSWSLINGASEHGITWHRMNAGIDEGDIIVQRRFEISPEDTVLTLNTKAFEAGISSFGDVLDALDSGGIAPVAQNLAMRTYFSRDQRPDAAGVLDFEAGADAVSRLVRGLSFGAGYANRLVTPKVILGGAAMTVAEAEITERQSTAAPGTVIAVEDGAIVVATADVDVRLTLAGQASVQPGAVVGLPAGERAALTDALTAVVPNEGAFRRLLRLATDLDLPDVKAADDTPPAIRSASVTLPATGDAATIVAAFLARLSGQADFTLGYVGDALRTRASRFPAFFAATAPLRIETDAATSTAEAAEHIGASIAAARKRIGYLADLVERSPGLAAPRYTIGLVETEEAGPAAPVPGAAVTFIVRIGAPSVDVLSDSNRVGQATIDALLKRLALFAEGFGKNSAFGDVPLMSENETTAIVHGRNRSVRDYARDACVHQLIERQVDRTPDAIALAYRGDEVSYRELDLRANRLAAALIERGVGPDVLVGLHLRRSIDLVVGALAIQKAGGAYVPLDPDFPADRIAFMVADSAAKVVITNRALAGSPSIAGANILTIEDVAGGASDARPTGRARPENLAYVIYTSGSTGRPKGVMVEHRNVSNFFSGMDDRIRIDGEAQPVWLAVTSLSFDISVLELFWTLARGFKVVLHASETHVAGTAGQTARARAKPLDFGLFYWGNDDGAGPAKYRLLLEGAKYADQNGFNAIWTPERHFGAFGGPYPNPAVTGAAVASVTRNLSIRAGSCVLPLHHPARVAEEWAVVDNISNGRVALALASGWMPEDFLLRPENAPPNNKTALFRDIEVLRQLWRGEKLEFEFGSGKVGIVTQPRPVQKELPIWVTSAGNPETYREAARLGANVLTHLLGQSVDELAGKIKIYRDTLAETGRNPDDYKVTLMLHTLMGEDREEVRELAREPMKDYLRSAAALIKQYAWAFPAFKRPAGIEKPMDIDLRSLDKDEMDAILDFAFQRYFEDSGLFGTVEDGLKRMDEIAGIGVDEVACLIDYGVPVDTVLERLSFVADLARQVREPLAEAGDFEPGLAGEIRHHHVTHLQCTPSMAAMFLMSADDRPALAAIKHMFIGGEAFHATLLSDLRAATSASVENMYGPTETTIWSSTLSVGEADGIVPIGEPIANTQLYVLDARQKPVPPGVPGELYIGGDGVTRGYLGRAELTAERFVANPFAGGRMYRTGDLVRIDPATGALRFLGRTDFQVKVRGYRIELGEIEARIGTFPGIREAVVMARTDNANDVRIVAYLRLAGGTLDEAALRAHVAEALPDYMVPSHFVVLDAYPLTPNMKVDRNRLPPPAEARAAVPDAEYVAPTDDVERTVAEIFSKALGLERVGVNDNFFTLGGHSLLAVQVHRELKGGIAPDLAITDLFRFPSVAQLSARIANRDKPDERFSRAAQRAAMRRNAMDRRAVR